MLATVRRAILGGHRRYIGPGDIVAGAISWWGLRAYNEAYCTGSNPCMDVVDTATGTVTNTINIRRDGSIDIPKLAALGAVSVTKLYDHTGNGHHHIQATLANMPTIGLNGLRGQPVMTFNGTSMFMEESGANSGIGNQPTSWAAVANSTGSASGRMLRGTGGGGFSFSSNQAGANQANLATNATVTATASNGSFHAVIGVLNGATSVVRVDADDTTGDAGSTNPGTTQQTMGWNHATAWFAGQIQEIGTWNGVALSAMYRKMINANAQTYWRF